MQRLLFSDKPSGMTSHDVIDRLRRITGERTIGHAGTLDPFATGLLLVAVGRESTRELQHFVGLDKEYVADIRLGQTSTTLDPEGKVTDGPAVELSSALVVEAMQSLTGPLLQIPPMHAAIKVGGKKLYELARQGKEIVREPRPVTVYEFALLSDPSTIHHTPCTITCRIRCSSGTYVRALARDLGAALGTVGYLPALRRTKVGPFSVEEAKKIDECSPQNWIDCCRATMIPSERKS
ncbi:tRNA pseudouridine(55) synthase TruB [Candidatus Uhrbacteria bacterium]|nr:tRNA pseudouridine(55) synthase TruB [Candidatus Uhrbacteria bacterium]